MPVKRRWSSAKKSLPRLKNSEFWCFCWGSFFFSPAQKNFFFCGYKSWSNCVVFVCRMYQDKLAQLKKQLQQLEGGTLPEYMKKLRKIDQSHKERLRINEIWYQYEVSSLATTHTWPTPSCRRACARFQQVCQHHFPLQLPLLCAGLQAKYSFSHLSILSPQMSSLSKGSCSGLDSLCLFFRWNAWKRTTSTRKDKLWKISR